MFAVPLGPVPFTLQTAVLILCVVLLSPGEALAVVGGYLVLGAIGLPVFSGMRGGFGVILGPTGGFLIGFFLGTGIAAFLRRMLVKRFEKVLPADIIAAVVLLIVSYVCGLLQLMAVAHMGLVPAFLAGIAPFILLDAIKAAVAIGLAVPLRKAIGRG
ncbi:MAG: biotin transporter BioY [Actinobacteria bacterium]|nr:biotin transporter BioY [Actinomycetota bacterium]